MNKTFVRIIGAIAVAALAYAMLSLSQFPRVVVGVVVALPSLVLMLVGRRHLGKSFSILPEAKGLVTTGLYSRIEHPLYTFLDLFLIGIIIAVDLPVLLWAWGVLVVVHIVQARREEKVLATALGADYALYRSRTWF